MKCSMALLALTLQVFVGGALRAEDKPPTNEQIEALIKKLVSPNKPPKIDGGGAVYPAGFDRDANSRVQETWLAIQKLGTAAFPYLIPHFDDEQYSFTTDAGSSDSNWSVGRACSGIVWCQLFPTFKFEGGESRPWPPSYQVHFRLSTASGAKAWWDTHKQKSLRELQIEVLEWTIAEESKAPEKYSNDARSRLMEMRAELRIRKAPLEPGVPWAP
jgi:hypothetical protein